MRLTFGLCIHKYNDRNIVAIFNDVLLKKNKIQIPTSTGGNSLEHHILHELATKEAVASQWIKWCQVKRICQHVRVATDLKRKRLNC